MSGWRDPESLVRSLAEEQLPSESPDVAAARRERIVPMLSQAVRQSAVDRERRVRRRRWAGITAAAAAVLLTLGLSLRPSTPAPTTAASAAVKASTIASIAHVTGTLVLTHAGRARVVSEGEHPALLAGDEMRTAADGAAEVKTERSAVRIGPATQLSVLAPSSVEERIRLGIGHVDLTVSKQPRAPRSVVVETPNAEVVVRGTQFSVAVARDGAKTTTRVRVREGSVWVVHSGGRDLVTAGEEWSSATPPLTSVKPTLVEPSASPTRAANGQQTRRRATSVAGSGRATAPAEAAGTLAEENRMFQTAVDARNRGDDRKAVEYFAALLTRHPKSRLAEEARVERMRALQRLGETKRAAAEARRYLADYAAGFARDEARSNALSEK